MSDKKALDDPQIASIAWTRFRRIMLWMALTGAGCVGIALLVLHWWAGRMPFHMIVATILGVWLTFMLGTGLMALAFLSSGTGHDQQVIDPLKDEASSEDE
ncbi:MAG TPA: hypothetical protein VJM09_01660 [Sphingobium sp.]|nr:hypothetical protein [Sphingobium sp.]